MARLRLAPRQLRRVSTCKDNASVIAGGPAPLIATALYANYHTGYAIAIYLAVCAVISYVSTAYMPDYTPVRTSPPNTIAVKLRLVLRTLGGGAAMLPPNCLLDWISPASTARLGRELGPSLAG
jgi:hypothetical protein